MMFSILLLLVFLGSCVARDNKKLRAEDVASNSLGGAIPAETLAASSPGWIAHNYYATAGCMGSPVEVHGWVTNLCVVEDLDPPESSMGSCDQGTVTTSYYNSLDCSPSTLDRTNHYHTTCEQDSAGGIFDKYTCTSESTLQLKDKFYFERATYKDSACSKGVLEFEAYRNGACIPDHSGDMESERYEYPKHYEWDMVKTCTGPASETDILPPLNLCELSEHDGNYDSTRLADSVSAPAGATV